MDGGHAESTFLEPYTTKVMTTYINASSTLKLHFLDIVLLSIETRYVGKRDELRPGRRC